MKPMRSMVTIQSRYGIYNGPYVEVIPVMLRTDYMGEIHHQAIRILLAKEFIPAGDFELIKEEHHEQVRDIYILALLPGIVFHGRN